MHVDLKGQTRTLELQSDSHRCCCEHSSCAMVLTRLPRGQSWHSWAHKVRIHAPRSRTVVDLLCSPKYHRARRTSLIIVQISRLLRFSSADLSVNLSYTEQIPWRYVYPYRIFNSLRSRSPRTLGDARAYMVSGPIPLIDASVSYTIS